MITPTECQMLARAYRKQADETGTLRKAALFKNIARTLSTLGNQLEVLVEDDLSPPTKPTARFTNSDFVHEIYEHFAMGRIDRLSEVLDEKIDFLSHAPVDLFPYLGRRRGRAEVLDALSKVHEKLEVLSFWPITTVTDDDQAALTVVVKLKERATRRVVTFLGAHFLRFRDGQIVEYRAIIDSLDAVRQLAPE